MRASARAGLTVLLVATTSFLGAGLVAAQVDPSKALVGTWRGELQGRFKKGAEASTVLALRIISVKQEDGKWVADARFGPNPVKVDIDTSGSKPSLRWAAQSGTTYDVSLLDDKNMVGTATLTREQAGAQERERKVVLEKKE